jgi:hypothetical protein
MGEFRTLLGSLLCMVSADYFFENAAENSKRIAHKQRGED